MRNIAITIFLLLVSTLFASDTIYVVHHKPASKVARIAFLPGWQTRKSINGANKKIDMYCQPLVWNEEKVKYDTLSAGWRLLGVDTTILEIMYISDTLPKGGFKEVPFEMKK